VNRTSRSAHARALAFLRSRLLGAVSLPSLIGAAWAWWAGAFASGPAGAAAGAGGTALATAGAAAGAGPAWLSLLRLAVALAGLAAVELMNLFGADIWKAGRGGQGPGRGEARGPGPAPRLPGNPVAARLRPAAIPRLLLLLAAAGLAALLYFAITVGPVVLAFLLPAAAVGALYVLSPFPYAFLGTALVPPLVAGGLSFVLTGRAPAACFLSALPVSLVSAGVILTYQVAYRGPRRAVQRALPVLACYVLADFGVAALLLARVYPRSGYFALLPAVVFPGWAARLLLTEPQDPVPATAVGVYLHSALCLAIAAGFFWG
jgi:hypothetical protein